MKKNISINISGVIFYIEEDCYPTLKSYLAAIHKYFANYEEGREIIEDIEGRIAEIFQENLRKDKQVISQDDVNLVMQTMGSISDFQEAEEDPAFHITYDDDENDGDTSPSFEIPTEYDYTGGGSTAVQVQPKNPSHRYEPAFVQEEKSKKPHPELEPVMLESHSSKEDTSQSTKRFYRDNRRKIVGGVASGLAHYLNIDAIWVRIVWALSLSGFFWYSEIPSLAFVVYLALWMITPESDELEENPQLKKLFRDPERGVIGGVSSGVASYLGISELLVRMIFIFTTFMFGTGIFVYLILWIIIPEAKTLTEKMQMRGQPINLSSIKENIQSNLENFKGEELGKLHKVILIPFHLLALLMHKTADFLRPFVGFTADFIRIVGGITLVLLSLALSIALVMLTFLLMGWGLENYTQLDYGPLYTLEASFGKARYWHIINAFFALFIPAFFIGLFGVMMLTRRIIWNHRFGWSIAGFWLISMIGFGISASVVANNFRVHAEIANETKLAPVEGVLTLDLFENEVRSQFYVQQGISIVAGDKTGIYLNSTVTATGKNHQNAAQNARMLAPVYHQKEKQISLGRYAKFTENALFYGQQLYLTLYIPKGQVFTISPALRPILSQTFTSLGTHLAEEEAGRLWKFNEDGELVPHFEASTLQKSTSTQLPKRLFNLEDFDEIEATGNLYLVIETTQGKNALDGDYQKVEIQQKGGKLLLQPKMELGYSKDIRVVIYSKTPHKITLTGACFAQMNLQTQEKLDVELTGASQLSVASGGKVIEELKANVSGSAELQALKATFQEAKIELSGASEAVVNITERLKVEARGASELRYLKKPKHLNTRILGASEVKGIAQ